MAERALRAWHLDLFTYVLSKVWFDLLFVYVLRLLPRPYCCPVGESPRQRLFFALVLKQCSAAESTATPCRESASAAALLAAAAALLAALPERATEARLPTIPGVVASKPPSRCPSFQASWI